VQSAPGQVPPASGVLFTVNVVACADAARSMAATRIPSEIRSGRRELIGGRGALFGAKDEQVLRWRRLTDLTRRDLFRT
jgi:hypothetical protein